MIAALYVSPKGPYPSMADVDVWTAERDAKRYAGPDAVVAHPPCGPWSRLSFLCTKQDRACALYAVNQVRAFGGVLEHPEGSQLWRECLLPLPGGLADGYGGFTVEVDQCAWGHVCRKRSWLYCVGLTRAQVHAGVRVGGVPSRRVTNGPRGDQSLQRATQPQLIHSPPLFAEWLVSLARAVRA